MEDKNMSNRLKCSSQHPFLYKLLNLPLKTVPSLLKHEQKVNSQNL